MVEKACSFEWKCHQNAIPQNKTSKVLYDDLKFDEVQWDKFDQIIW